MSLPEDETTIRIKRTTNPKLNHIKSLLALHGHDFTKAEVIELIADEWLTHNK